MNEDLTGQLVYDTTTVEGMQVSRCLGVVRDVHWENGDVHLLVEDDRGSLRVYSHVFVRTKP